MSIIKEQLSTSKLASSKEYREAFVSAFLKRYIPFQIRTIRKKRNVSQQQLAEDSKVTQGVISRAEDPDYGNLTFNTILRIAAGFDLAFIGKFVRFTDLVKEVDEMSEESMDLPSFLDECQQEHNEETIAAKAVVHVGAGAERKAQSEPKQIPKDTAIYTELLNRQRPTRQPVRSETLLGHGGALTATGNLG